MAALSAGARRHRAARTSRGLMAPRLELKSTLYHVVDLSGRIHDRQIFPNVIVAEAGQEANESGIHEGRGDILNSLKRNDHLLTSLERLLDFAPHYLPIVGRIAVGDQI
jgi:hypothetical protein